MYFITIIPTRIWTHSFRRGELEQSAHNPPRRIPGSNLHLVVLSKIFMYTVYVIKSVEGLRYIGQTGDIEKRLFEHNAGISRWTSRGVEWKMVYSEEYDTRSEAVKRERFLKTGKGRDFLDTVTDMDRG